MHLNNGIGRGEGGVNGAHRGQKKRSIGDLELIQKVACQTYSFITNNITKMREFLLPKRFIT